MFLLIISPVQVMYCTNSLPNNILKDTKKVAHHATFFHSLFLYHNFSHQFPWCFSIRCSYLYATYNLLTCPTSIKYIFWARIWITTACILKASSSSYFICASVMRVTNILNMSNHLFLHKTFYIPNFSSSTLVICPIPNGLSFVSYVNTRFWLG